MNQKKYEDMAYMNPTGRAWLRALYEPTTWASWLHRASGIGLTELPPDRYAADIVVAAIWHFGFAHDLDIPSLGGRILRTSYRLRGVADVKIGYEQGYNCYPLPREFVEFDDFLEHEVRPQLPCLG